MVTASEIQECFALLGASKLSNECFSITDKVGTIITFFFDEEGSTIQAQYNINENMLTLFGGM